MEQTDIHFRAGGKISHAGVEMLPGGKDIERVIIERIEFKDSEMVNGRREDGVWLAHFAANPYTQLPMLLNVTNRKRIVKLFPECEGYLARLKNIPVRMTKEMTRDPQGGGQVWGLRISQIPASEEPKKERKEITADKLEAVIAWAKENKKTIEDIKATCDMSQEIEDAIIDALSTKE